VDAPPSLEPVMSLRAVLTATSRSLAGDLKLWTATALPSRRSRFVAGLVTFGGLRQTARHDMVLRSVVAD
jgi:hypothetical protein